MTRVKIRSGHVEDIEKCLEIYFREPFFQQYNPTKKGMEKTIHDCLGDETQKFVLATDESNSIMGFALYDTLGAFSRSGYLRLIVVDNHARQKRVGEALVKYLEETCGHSNGFCLLVTSHNIQAQHFYQKLGFVKVGELENYVKLGLNEFIFFKK